LVVVMPLTDQNDTDRPARGLYLSGEIQSFGVDSREQHIVAASRQRIRKASQHTDEEGVRNVLAGNRIIGHHHRDCAVALQAQVARAHVDRIVQRARQFGDAVARFVVHQGALIKGP
jgi:hypothetical protein